MQTGIEEAIAGTAARLALAATIVPSLRRTAELLRELVHGEGGDKDRRGEAAQLLLDTEGALAQAEQPGLGALVRLLRMQIAAADSVDAATPAALADAARALERGVASALERALLQREVRAAELLPCWQQLAAAGASADASPAALLSLRLPADQLAQLPLPPALPCEDPLTEAERALLACLRADDANTRGPVAQAFAAALAAVIAQPAPASEQACWLILHAYLLELAPALGKLSAGDKKILAATVRAMRLRPGANRALVLEPLARDALYALSIRPLQTDAGAAVARLFRLDWQLGKDPREQVRAPQLDEARASLHAALGCQIAELEGDPARIGDGAVWHALAAAAALDPCMAALAGPLGHLSERLQRMQEVRQHELLAAVLIGLHAWSADSSIDVEADAAGLAAAIALVGDADPAIASAALFRQLQAGGARHRLTALCDAIRTELDAAEQPLEAAWQSGDCAAALQHADEVLRQVGHALALTGLTQACDAVDALRTLLFESSGADPHAVLPALAAGWVRLSASTAMLPLQLSLLASDGGLPAERPRTTGTDDGKHLLRTIFIEEAGGHLGRLRRHAAQHTEPDSTQGGERSGERGDAAALRAVHTVAGCSATIGQPAMAELALALEAYLMAAGWRPGDALLVEALDALGRMLEDFVASGQCTGQPELLARLQTSASEWTSSAGNDNFAGIDARAGIDATEPGEPMAGAGQARRGEQAAASDAIDGMAAVGKDQRMASSARALPLSEIGAVPLPDSTTPPLRMQPPAVSIDEVSAHELQAVFDEEAADLLPQLELALRAWQQHPDGREPPMQMLRVLHTLKGSARMAGRYALGDEFHQVEADIGALAQQPPATVLPALPALLAWIDRWMRGDMPAASGSSMAAHATDAADAAATGTAADAVRDVGASVVARTVAAQAYAVPAATADGGALPNAAQARSGASALQLRVSAGQLARVADAAAALWVGNASIGDIVQDQRHAVGALSEDLGRLRAQLRELEIEAESRIVSRATQGSDASFDPLEFDRYTRLHELTRMMAESIADFAGAQRGLAREVERLTLAATTQARDMRRFQLDLQAMRSQPLRAAEPRLRTLLRQAAQEAGREAVLVLAGADVEIERSLLDQLIGSFGHLLRNAVVHGIEAPEQRAALGKPRAGTVTLDAALAGNELRLRLQDDGRGLDLARVRERAIAIGLLGADAASDEAALAALIFAPGFSTATEVTALSGRGIGMDAVRAEVQALGGRITVDSVAGQGCRFTLAVPVALASLPVLLATAGACRIALPAAGVLQVVQPGPGQIERNADGQQIVWQENRLPLRHLGAAMGGAVAAHPDDAGRLPVVIMQEGNRRLALQLDAVSGQRELMVKRPGPQLAQVPGIVGATLLGDGSIALILDPFRLPETPPATAEPAPERPLVLVADDSLTVRRASQRLLERHGYAVALARDGIEALDRLGERRPMALLLDIEMPRMDGFELLAALRADAGLSDLPVVMITSRIAERHRERAQQLGVIGYLGKPFDEDALLALLAQLRGGARLAA